MAKTLSFDMDNFNNGLNLLEDDSTAPVGSARRMLNVLITDRGGVAPRPGTEIIGTKDLSGNETTGFFVFKKSFGEKEVPIKVSGTDLEAYTVDHGWFKVELPQGDPVANQEFDFVPNLVNTDNEDFVYFSSRYTIYSRWNGQVGNITAALSGGETSITVDSTLEPDVYYSGTTTGSSATTAVRASANWATDQWRKFYIYFTSGPSAGNIGLITGNTGDTITFNAGPGDPGTGASFEIRTLKFDYIQQGTFAYNGQVITVTGIPTATTLTVGSAHSAPIDTPIYQVPQPFPDAPRGSRMDTLLGRTVVGRVRSGLSRDAGGALQGSNSAGSVWVSKINDPKDFTYSATRVAGEGDILSTPYGGGEITDIAVQEDVVYIYKKTYIEAVQYSQDANDLAIREPLKPGAGSVGRVIKGKDDHYFITEDKQFTSIGRVIDKDATVQTENIGLPIKRLLDEYEFSNFNGVEFRNRILFSCRSSEAEENNNVTLVFNKRTGTFEGVWNIGAFGFDTYLDELYYANSSGPNVYRMFTDIKSDIIGPGEIIPITAVWESNYFNLLPIKGNIQGIQSLALEGYIGPNTEFQFDLYKDFSSESALTFTFSSVHMDDEEFLLGDDLVSFLGNNPLGVDPLGTIDAPGADGRRRFSFIVYFPYIYGQYFSTSVQSEGEDQDWEIIRMSLGLKESISTKVSSIKSI